MVLLFIIVAVVVTLLVIRETRLRFFTKPLFSLFKQILPPLSQTEQEAMEAGSVWWDGELFRGNPDWSKLHQYPKARLNDEEQAFLDNQVMTLLKLLDDHQIVQKQKDLPDEVWRYLREEGFFALIISKDYGGKGFSAIANSTIVGTIAARSFSAAVTVMVPNSLGPGELLSHYGTQAQKDRWLPGLASGQEIPCFALTGPEAGSDAGSIPDLGIVCEQQFEGEMTLGIRLNWNKRYITLAPVATVLGLAFKLRDPDGLIGDRVDIGITCALIPTDHPGVQVGDRHDPLNLAFMNGPTFGTDVFIPLSWVIGGVDYVGKGWRMLVECLSAGRGISLPALGTATGHLSTRATSAYAYVRKQFGQSIGRFEGVEEALARIGGMTYQMEAVRRLTAGSLDLGQAPAIVTAIAKYHMTEMGRQVIDDAMDIHGGRGIQLGDMNYLANTYMAMPVAITVEGANILTRNLMIFGQGATRCHPYVLQELQAAANPDEQAGLDEFDKLIRRHIGFGLSNFMVCTALGLTGAKLLRSPVSGPTATYYKQLTRMSRALALCSDLTMLILGGSLKRKERISARLGDLLSHLYLASATLKYYEECGRPAEELPFVCWSVERNLYLMGQAIQGFLQNFQSRVLAAVLSRVIFPLGNPYKMPSDRTDHQVSEILMTPGAARERLTHLCKVTGGQGDPVAIIEQAFLAMSALRHQERKLVNAQRENLLPRKVDLIQLVSMAVERGVLTSDEGKQLLDADKLRQQAIQVNHFKSSELEPVQPEQSNAA